MKYVAIALLAVMPVLAERWERCQQARAGLAEARREIRREMDSAHREWRIEFRQVREEMRRSWR